MIIISFNSYKGGSCRTTTCYNTLPYLAKALNATSRQPILVFDTDLDSMGLTNLFLEEKFVSESGYSAEDLFINSEDKPEVQEINRHIRVAGFSGSVENNAWFFERAFHRVGNALGLEDDGSVLFCGADCDTPSITDDQYKSYADKYPLSNLIRALSRMPESDRPKAVVFDCAAGDQPSTRVILKTARIHVMCMRPTLQFRIGTRNYMLKTLPKEFNNVQTGVEHKVILLPTAVANNQLSPDEPKYAEAEQMLSDLKYRIVSTINQYIVNQIYRSPDVNYTLISEMVDGDEVGIPEIERFKWRECLLYNMEPLTNAEIRIKERYDKLAQVIVKE